MVKATYPTEEFEAMTDPNRAAEQDNAPTPEAFGPSGGAEPMVEGQVDEAIAAMTAEVAGLKDKVLRGLADMENMRRRTEREVADARTYGVTSFAREMLTVADNLRRAVDSVPADARESAQGPLQTLIQGLELTERDFLVTLGRFGVKKLEPLGQKFDPNMHQAMFEVQDESVPTGTVKQVVQAGYAIGERVLRPALVGVAKGGPKAAAVAEAARPANGAAQGHGEAAE